MSRSHQQAIDTLVDAVDQVLQGPADDVPGRLTPALAALVTRDDWLDPAYAAPDPDRYQQYLLHRDPDGRFSIVSFVWGPGQATPIHDHRIWGLVGVLRGAEIDQRFARRPDGTLVPDGPEVRLEAGDVATLSPETGDIHRVANAHADRVSISIHLYGADIGQVERATYDLSGNSRRFVSGYAGPARVTA
jgi:3-mercaptopropionate dioxygenase